MKRTLLILSLTFGLAACDDVPVTPANTAVSGQSQRVSTEVDKNGDGWPDTAWDNSSPSVFDDRGSIGSNAGWSDVSQVPILSPESSSSASSATASSAPSTGTNSSTPATPSSASRSSSANGSSASGNSDSSSIFDDSGNQNDDS